MNKEKYTPSSCDLIFDEYFNMLMREDEKQQIQTQNVLDEIKTLVSDKYFNAITSFIRDEENSIIGDLKIVSKPIGVWQDEHQDDDDDENYWNILKGMFVNQRCGYAVDDYSGTLEIKLTDDLYLRCSFSM